LRHRTRYRTNATRLILLSTLLVAGGCFSLGRGAQIQQQYVLGGGLPQQGGAVSGELAGLTIGVRRLQLAAYLEAPFLLVRRGPNELTFSEFHRWGEGVAEGINRTVAAHLGARTALRGIDVAPWPAGERYDYVIQLHVSRFEGSADADPLTLLGEAQMSARWEIIRQTDGAVLTRGATEYRQDGWRVGDYGALVSMLDEGLHRLTDDLVRGLVALGGR